MESKDIPLTTTESKDIPLTTTESKDIPLTVTESKDKHDKVEPQKVIISFPPADLDVYAIQPYLIQKVKELKISKETMEEKEFLDILKQWKDKIEVGDREESMTPSRSKASESEEIKRAFENIKNSFSNGKITDEKLEDPESKGYNFCYPMKEVIKEGNKAGLTNTLIEIGTTCRYGITSRIMVMYISIYDSVKR